MRALYLLLVLLLSACQPPSSGSALMDEGDSSITVSLANRVVGEGRNRFELVYSVFDPNMIRRKMVACVNIPENACHYDCDNDAIFCGTYLGSKGGRSFFRVPAELNESIEVRANVYSETEFEQVTINSLPVDTWRHSFTQDQDFRGASETSPGSSNFNPDLDAAALQIVQSTKCSNGSCHGGGQLGFNNNFGADRKADIKRRVDIGSMPPTGSPGLTIEEKRVIRQW